MRNTASFCRAQEAMHAKRAADSDLANVKAVASAAAIAWGQEAVAAEKREGRHDRRDDAVPASETEAAPL